MSADNWATCPKCLAEAKAKKAALEHAVQDAYGKVPIEEFDEMRTEAEKPVNIDQTLREDYELFIEEDTGLFRVIYDGFCKTCGFGKKYRYSEQLPLPTLTTPDAARPEAHGEGVSS